MNRSRASRGHTVRPPCVMMWVTLCIIPIIPRKWCVKQLDERKIPWINLGETTPRSYLVTSSTLLSTVSSSDATRRAFLNGPAMKLDSVFITFVRRKKSVFKSTTFNVCAYSPFESCTNASVNGVADKLAFPDSTSILVKSNSKTSNLRLTWSTPREGQLDVPPLHFSERSHVSSTQLVLRRCRSGWLGVQGTFIPRNPRVFLVRSCITGPSFQPSPSFSRSRPTTLIWDPTLCLPHQTRASPEDPPDDVGFIYKIDKLLKFD